MDYYFTITQTYHEQQGLAYVGQCAEGAALEWWKGNRYSYSTWQEVMHGIRKYYGKHFKVDRGFNEINELSQTGTVWKYLHNLDRLNVYTKRTDHHLMNIILNCITPHLR